MAFEEQSGPAPQGAGPFRIGVGGGGSGAASVGGGDVLLFRLCEIGGARGAGSSRY